MQKVNLLKSHKVILIIGLINCNSINGQTPGGLAGSTFWLKSDALTSTSVNNATNGNWTTIIPSAPGIIVNTPMAANQPRYRNGSGTTVTNRFNYNPYINFDGINDRLRNTANNNLGNSASGISVFQVVGFESGIVSFHWQGTNGKIKLRGDGIHQISTGNLAGTNNEFRHTPTFQGYLTSLSGTNLGTTGRFNGFLSPQFSNSIPDVGTGIQIGSNIATGEFMTGGCAEFIVFPSILTAAENLKVESYLAVKYGITLGTDINLSNYTLSNGTVTWTGNSTYQNNIIGIGRDANTRLLQKQSHNYDDTVRVYKGTLAATNIANTATFALDNSTVMIGADKGKMCASATTLSEIPIGLLNCTLYARIEREWRITKTNCAENFNMDFKLATCANPGAVNAANLRLLVDDDGNFANGGTQCYSNGDGSGMVITYANPVITISSMSNTHIPNDQTRFITIGTVDFLSPLPIELISFEANLNESNNVNLTWKTGTERDNDYFSVEKSIDGINWDFLGTVDGFGTTSFPQTYVLEDPNSNSGTNYYKLKQTDLNGSITEQGIRSVEINSEDFFTISPNPSGKVVTIKGDYTNNYMFEVSNSLGQKISLDLIFKNRTEMQLNAEKLRSGVYYITLTNFNSTKKVLKLLIN